jgi:F0F1-type ATP synthase membrane subunit c/vacuolar-type H+-ATPase subunit K
MQTSPQLPGTLEKNWFERNWKWFVPSLLGGLAILIIGVALAIVGLVMVSIKHSDVYTQAMKGVSENPEVQQELGTPLKADFFIMGYINTSSSSSHAELTIPLSGPKGTATVYVVASKDLGEWSFERLIVKIDGSGKKLNLLHAEQGALPPEAGH